MHLSTQDLLRARLVSKRFVQLSKLLELDVIWSRLSEAKGSSLVLFVQRHCAGPEGLRMIISLPDYVGIPPPEPFWLRVGLASSCHNLRKLLCYGSRLKLPEASTCLRLLPLSLESLALDAPFALLDDPRLHQMQQLTFLALSGYHKKSKPFSAEGLRCLKALEVFEVSEEYYDGRLDASSFTHPTLTSLELDRDPFDGSFNLSQLPSLHTFAMYSQQAIELPAWLEGQSIPELKLDDFEQLQSCVLQRLHCSRLTFATAEYDSSWFIADLLSMPRLLELRSFARHGIVGVPVALVGSHADYQALLQKACLSLEYPLELQIPDTSAVMPLRKNGHALVCMCSACVQ